MSWEDDLKLHVISTCSLPSTYIHRFGSLLLANPAFPAIPHLLQVRPYYIGEQVFSAGLVSLYLNNILPMSPQVEPWQSEVESISHGRAMVE